MALVTYTYTFSDGTGHTASGTQVQTSLNEVKAQVNGNLDDSNINAPAITKFLSLVAAAYGTKVSFGSTSLGDLDSAVGRSKTATSAVAHGLGATPSVVIAVGHHVGVQEETGNHAVAVSVANFGPTTFDAVATVAGTSNNPVTMYWVALG